MQVSLSIIRYPKRFVFFAFMAMAVHRLPLSFYKKIDFYKLLGCGRNGSFDIIPDLRQWGILAVHPVAKPLISDDPLLLKKIYGGFIYRWFRFFKCEVWTVLLEPIEGHGRWNGKKVFGDLPKYTDYEERIAILTRATIRLSKIKYFWRHVAAVTKKMKRAKGFVTSVGIGEIPWIMQATFSVWENKSAMKDFAYRTPEHEAVIKKTREQRWYSEEMFVRFKITGSCGSIHGKDPLKVKL